MLKISSPISGQVQAINTFLQENPDTMNDDPYGKGWMIKIKITNATEIDELLSSDAYKELIGA